MSKKFRVASVVDDDDEFEGFGFHATRRRAKKHALMVAAAVGHAVNVIEYRCNGEDIHVHDTIEPSNLGVFAMCRRAAKANRHG